MSVQNLTIDHTDLLGKVTWTLSNFCARLPQSNLQLLFVPATPRRNMWHVKLIWHVRSTQILGCIARFASALSRVVVLSAQNKWLRTYEYVQTSGWRVISPWSHAATAYDRLVDIVCTQI